MDLLTAAKNMVLRLHGEAKAPPVELAYQELRQAVIAEESKPSAADLDAVATEQVAAEATAPKKRNGRWGSSGK